MQTIMTTFERLRSSSLPNKHLRPDGQHLPAALNYAIHGRGIGTGPTQLGSMHGYDSGGLQPGMPLVRNDTGRPEPVLSGRPMGFPHRGIRQRRDRRETEPYDPVARTAAGDDGAACVPASGPATALDARRRPPGPLYLAHARVLR